MEARILEMVGRELDWVVVEVVGGGWWASAEFGSEVLEMSG